LFIANAFKQTTTTPTTNNEFDRQKSTKNYFIFLYKYIYVNVFFYLIKKKNKFSSFVLFLIIFYVI